LIYKVIILSFVVQNFYSTPFLMKTQRANALVNASNTQLLSLFIKTNLIFASGHYYKLSILPVTIALYVRFFQKGFFKFFKNLHSTNLGIMSLNLSKSLFAKTYRDLNTQFYVKQKPKKIQFESNFNVKYLQPITLVSFSFHKKTYDTLMVFIITMLANSYNTPYNFYRLYYGFLIKSTNFDLYPFLNLFYFKLKQF